MSPAASGRTTVGQVFVAGGLPTVTYVRRAELGLEERVRAYLDERHRILSLSGPTKSGKTVLLRAILQGSDALWLSGGQIATLEDFWSNLYDQMNVGATTASTTRQAGTAGSSSELGGSLVPGGVGVTGRRSSNESETTERSMTVTRTASVAGVVRTNLMARLVPLVIDDFHYVPANVQQSIVRNLKDPVFNGLPVIVASVPHRAYDAVRVEREMTGRLETLEIAFWSTPELVTIADEGFKALNVNDAKNVRDRLARESFKSPHLMQDFCLNACRQGGIQEVQRSPVELPEPTWDEFFKGRASAASRAAFELLSRGRRQRTDRQPRELRDGTVTDIYGAVLAAIAHTGPLTQLTYGELRTSLREVLQSEPPQRHEVTRVLEQMARVAREEIEGEPVVDYDSALATLYISDPFFAYYLRWVARPGLAGANDRDD